MLTDYLNTFSDKQAVSATAASTYIVDVSLGDTGPSENLSLFMAMSGYAGAGTISVSLMTSDAVTSGGAALDTPQTVAIYTVPTKYITAGKGIAIASRIPHNTKRYLSLTYTIGGSFTTTGVISAMLTPDVQADDKLSPVITPVV